MINFIQLPLLLRLDVFDLCQCGEVVSEAHTDSIADYCADAEGEDAMCGLS